jgi:hypothetical protein
VLVRLTVPTIAAVVLSTTLPLAEPPPELPVISNLSVSPFANTTVSFSTNVVNAPLFLEYFVAPVPSTAMENFSVPELPEGTVMVLLNVGPTVEDAAVALQSAFTPEAVHDAMDWNLPDWIITLTFCIL